MVDIQSATAEIISEENRLRRKKERIKKLQDENIVACPIA